MMYGESYVGFLTVEAERADRLNTDFLPLFGRNSVDAIVPGFNVGFPTGETHWVPEHEFLRTYRKITALPFSIALEYLYRGCCVRRRGWEAEKHLEIKHSEGSAQSGLVIYLMQSDPTPTALDISWTPTQEDLFATDWSIL